MYRVCVFVVLCLVCVVGSDDVSKLDVNQPGVCVTTLKQPKTRVKVFMQRVTRPYTLPNCRTNCRRKKIVNVRKTKKENYVETVNRTMCCGGWSYSEFEGKASCKPLCQPACPQGADCIAPDTCLCKPPLVPDITPLTACVPPPCNPGYRRNQTDVCEPVCATPCGNGNCTAPDSCTCHEGYIQRVDHVSLCQLICPTNCVVEGCLPSGCTCDAGVELCLPVCKNECDNGRCVAPDVCKCHDGYINPAGNVSLCEPICPSSCVNGRCHSPNVCTCDAGFESRDGKSCVPVCKNGCGNGKCVAPDVCECDKGYIKNNTACVPHCAKECKNGLCAGPDRCECLQGYALDSEDQFICSPVCERPCVKGTCVAPNMCECKPGYAQDEQDQYSCRPICSRPCGDAGRCVAPEKCTCFPGFKVDEQSGACKPACVQPCINGQCTQPDRCSCNDGFRPLSKYACVPHCSPPCFNADCVSPGVCSCFQGYEKLNNSNCTPKCDDCTNGSCSAPGECRCNEGFTKMNGSCQPVCSDPCENGLCVAPENCVCNPGYTRINSTCTPVCTQLCINGVCSAPNICTCKSEYSLSNDSYTCKKPCLRPCHMGECSIDGLCECRDGYSLSLDDAFTCEPIKEVEIIDNKTSIRPNCSSCLGKCNPNDICRCENGTVCEQVLAAMQEAPKEPVAERYMSEIPWIWVYGAVGLLVLLAVVMGAERIWRQRKNRTKSPSIGDCQESWAYNSVLPSGPGTLLMRDSKNFSAGDRTGQNSQDRLMSERERTYSQKLAEDQTY